VARGNHSNTQFPTPRWEIRAVLVTYERCLCALLSRAVEPEPKQFYKAAGAGTKNFKMVEPELEIWVPVP